MGGSNKQTQQEKRDAVGGAVNAFLHSGCEYGTRYIIIIYIYILRLLYYFKSKISDYLCITNQII